MRSDVWAAMVVAAVALTGCDKGEKTDKSDTSDDDGAKKKKSDDDEDESDNGNEDEASGCSKAVACCKAVQRKQNQDQGLCDNYANLDKPTCAQVMNNWRRAGEQVGVSCDGSAIDEQPPLVRGDAPAPVAPAAAPQSCGSPATVPAIPATRSNPPSLVEWSAACDVNTQGAGSQARDCTMKVMREWLQVTCRGDITGHELMENFGQKGLDYFEQVQLGSMASFVLRLRKGVSQKIRICRANERASLFVSWPPSSERPTIIALAAGPACDGSAFGSSARPSTPGTQSRACSEACPHGLNNPGPSPQQCAPCPAGYSCRLWGGDPVMDDPGVMQCVCNAFANSTCDITR